MLSNPWYLSLKPDLVTPLGSDSKCIRTLLVEDFWLFGIKLPQYSGLPIIKAEVESPSYNIKESLNRLYRIEILLSCIELKLKRCDF